MNGQTRRSLLRALFGAPLALAAGPAVAKMLPEAPRESLVDLIEQRMGDAYTALQERMLRDMLLHGQSMVGLGTEGLTEADFEYTSPGGAYGGYGSDRYFGNSYMTYGRAYRNGTVGKEIK